MTKQCPRWQSRRCRAATGAVCLLGLFVVCFYLQLPARGQGYTNTVVPILPTRTSKQPQIAVNSGRIVANGHSANTPVFRRAPNFSQTAFAGNRAIAAPNPRSSSQSAQYNARQQVTSRHPQGTVAGVDNRTSGRATSGPRQAAYQSPPNQSPPQEFLVPPRPGNTPLSEPKLPTAPQRLPPGPPLRAGEFAFNFSNAPWELVLKQFAYQNGMSLQITQPATGTFTYFDEKRYSTSQALDILNDYLLPQGSILVRQTNKLTLLAACPDTRFDLDLVVGMVYSGLS